MRLTAFLLFYFSIAIVAYFMGVPTYATTLLMNNQSMTLDCNPSNFGINQTSGGAYIMPTDQEKIKSYTNCVDTTSILATFVLFLVAIGLASLLLSYSAMYIIPLVMLYAIISIIGYLLVPINVITDMMPMEMRAIIIILFNLLNLLMAVSFIRGGQV